MTDLDSLTRGAKHRAEKARAKPSPTARPKASPAKAAGEAERNRLATRARARNAAVKEIGPLPPVADAARKAAAGGSLKLFFTTYLKARFPLPFSRDHDKVIAKLERCVREGGQFALAMPRGSGKALALDTPLPTPNGWTTMGEVQVGDELYDETGAVCRVAFATEVQQDRRCYRVTFDDGESVVCCADHLWAVNDRYSRQNPLTLRTEDMIDRLVLSNRRGWTEYRYTIPVAGAITGRPTTLHIAPYILGVWLGDGATASARVTIGDRDLDDMRRLIERHEPFNAAGQRKTGAACASYTVGGGRQLESPERVAAERTVIEMTAAGHGPRAISDATGIDLKTVGNIRHRMHDHADPFAVSLNTRLRWVGVLGNKHIPAAYLRAPEEDRLALLRGLMDTDGSIDPNGVAEYVTKLPRLRDDVVELLHSLGYKPAVCTRFVEGRPYFRISFAPTDGRRVFDLARKAARQVTRERRVSANRVVVSIEPVPSVPVRCVQVDSPSHLYLCGRGMVPTHNTTMIEAAILWAILYGYRRFVVVLAATGELADDIVQSIKEEIEGNALLLADFPEACWPVVKLDGTAQRGKTQTLGGVRTKVQWGAETFRLAVVPGAPCSGAVVAGRGLDGAIRGRKKRGPEGEQLRPDLVVLDDPQTDESARMLGQTEARERLIDAAVLGMAGPGKDIAAIMPCTVICPDDLSDRTLKKPQWNGERMRLVDRMPDNLEWWRGEYAEARRESLQRFGDGRLADALYAERREFADRGADLPWPDRFNPKKCRSALQEAMNLLIDRPASFWSEGQNEPRSLNPDADALSLNPAALVKRLTGLPRGTVPREASRLTAGIDLSESVLWWVVCAWDQRFGGSVIDYGCYPDQRRTYFRQADAAPSLRDEFKGQPVEAAVFSGLKALLADLMAREYAPEDGEPLRVERALVDSGDLPDQVYDAIRAAGVRATVHPSKGFGVTATGKPVAEWPVKVGEKRGKDWVHGLTAGGRRLLKFGSNEWKTFLAERFRTPEGTPGALRLFGEDGYEHQLFADHCAAEYPDRVKSEKTGRTQTSWSLRPGRENHLFDCAVLAAVAASVAGLTWTPGTAAGDPAAKKRPRRVVGLDELYAAANAAG